MTTLKNQTAFVTGTSRGLGKEFVAQLLDRGVSKVYATARNTSGIDTTDPRVVALELDVTDPESVRAAAAAATDVTVLINNAGIADATSVLDADQTKIRREFETNFFGAIDVSSALAGTIVGNGGGVILNVHSVLSWIGIGHSYSATKAALWSATNSMRIELDPQGVQVVGLHVGYIDTDMAADAEGPKTAPESVVRQALDGIESGAYEVLADDLTRNVKAGLSADIPALYADLAS